MLVKPTQSLDTHGKPRTKNDTLVTPDINN